MLLDSAHERLPSRAVTALLTFGGDTINIEYSIEFRAKPSLTTLTSLVTYTARFCRFLRWNSDVYMRW